MCLCRGRGDAAQLHSLAFRFHCFLLGYPRFKFPLPLFLQEAALTMHVRKLLAHNLEPCFPFFGPCCALSFVVGELSFFLFFSFPVYHLSSPFSAFNDVGSIAALTSLSPAGSSSSSSLLSPLTRVIDIDFFDTDKHRNLHFTADTNYTLATLSK